MSPLFSGADLHLDKDKNIAFLPLAEQLSIICLECTPLFQRILLMVVLQLYRVLYVTCPYGNGCVQKNRIKVG